MSIFKKQLLFLLTFIVSFSFAQRGKDGNSVVNTAGKIVNEYTTLTADASIGATSIIVTTNGLNANNRFAAPLAAGDLIMIIQVQGVTMNGIAVAVGGGIFFGFPNDNTLGDITSYNNCGNYEFAEIAGIPSGNTTTINIVCGLQHDYTASGRVQIVRVPRFNSLTINSPGTITCPAWGGAFTGGIVAIEVLGNTVINSGTSITASSLGFRGGAVGPQNNAGYGGGQMGTTSFNEGAEKGEGIGGYQNDYNVNGGRYCRGAFANAGGGGDSHNSGGGGGSNAGSLAGWDGLGNPSISTATWAQAWNLEVAGFSTHTSPGGGRGGYSFASSNRNALVEGPWVSGTNLWNGDFRRNNGGMGGRPLDYSTGRLFMGGGGGCGDYDDNAGGGGGKGGGLIYIMSYGTISGTGNISANGAVGGNAGGSGIDAAGGAGAGGTIILNSVGTISGITANANGGAGGNQVVGGFVIESEGPGGGGGGGYIAISNGVITCNAAGGANGTTNSNSLNEFPPNGATRGAAGTNNATISFDTITTTDVTICSGNSATLTATIVGSFPATINWYNTAAGGTPIGTGNTFTTPVLVATTTYYAGFCPGTYRKPVVVTVAASLPVTVNSPNICPGQIATLTANGGTSYSWSSGTTVTGVNTATASPAVTTTYTVTGTTAGCSGTATATVTVTPLPTISVNSPTICPGQTATLTASGGISYSWSSGATSTGVNTASASPVVTTTYTVTGSVLGGCSNTASATVTITPLPTITVNSPTICAGQAANLSASGGTSYTWSAGAASTGINTATASPASTTSYTVTGTTAGCSNTAVSTVNITPLPVISVNSPSICAGLTASLTANGGISYTWSAGATSTGVNTADAAPAITSSYTVTGTTGSCSGNAIATVTINPLPTISVNSTSICPGQTATLTANGGTSYSWSAGASSTGVNTASASPAVTTTYTVTGTTSGCSNTATATVTITPLPTITVNSPTICAGQTANLSANGGTSYTWSAGAASTGVNTASASPAATTSYTVTGTTAGCSNTALSTVTITPLPVITVNSPSICIGQTANLSANGGTSYTWSAGASSTGINTADATPAITTSYSVTGTTGSCSGTAVATVTINPLPIITVNSPSICPGLTATLTANGATTYTWSAGATATGINTADATPAATTTYTVTGTTNGCSNTATATVTVAGNLSITVNSPTICSGQTASLTANGGISYTWTTGATSTGVNTASANPVASTSYTVTGTTGSCSGTAIATVTVTSLPFISVNSPTICSGQTATLTATGGTSYTWSTGVTSTGVNTATASPLSTIAYTVTGTSNGCSNTDVAVVTVTSLPAITVNSPSVCAGQTATLTANGGTSYTWSAGVSSTGVNTGTASPVNTTTYTVTGTTNGCSNTATSTVTISPLPVIAVNSPTICSGQTASLTASGGTTYTWSTGANSTGVNTADAAPLVTTTYTVTGTTSGCSDTAVSTVTVTPSPFISVNSPSICNGQIANLSASGGTSYTWSTGATATGINTADATPSSTITYTVTGTTAGCSNTAVALVTVTPLPAITVNSPTICSGLTASLTANGATSYTWSAGATSTGINTATANPVTTSNYTVTGTANGCADSTVATVTVVAAVSVTVNSPAICSGQTANLTANGATSYVWLGGATTTGSNTAITPSLTVNTTFTVVGTSGSCSDTAFATVTVNNCNPPVANFTASPLTLCSSGCVDFTDLSTNSPTTWNWSFQGGTPSSSSSQGPVNVCYSSPADYSITLIVSNAQGSDTMVRTNYIHILEPIPVTITGNTSISACETTTLTAQPAGNAYHWGGIPSTNIECEQCQAVNVSPPATQQFYVNYLDPNGCPAGDTTTVTVTAIYTYYMPTAIAPNSSSGNSELHVHGRGIESIDLKIYSRIGTKVFETTDINEGWNGTYHGIALNDNVCTYTLRVEFCNGEVKEEKGTVTIVK